MWGSKMKNVKRSIVRMVLALVMVFGLALGNSGTAEAAGSVTYTNAAQIAQMVFKGYNNGVYGPITVSTCIYQKGSFKRTAYLVTLSGTENVKNQSTGYLTDALSGFNLKNHYYSNVVNVINNNIPRGSRLILAGHSLGGMIAQQVAADDGIKRNYVVMNTVTFGSPLLSAGSREGIVKRLGDTSDVIPYMSGSIINNTAWAIAGLQREDGHYWGNSLNAHVNSYTRADVWGKYDVTGTKWGGATLTVQTYTTKYFHSPTNVKW